MNVMIVCPKHGEVKSNSDGFFHPDVDIKKYCPACVGEAQTARYDDYVRRVKAKNPNWKPLEAQVTPMKPGGER